MKLIDIKNWIESLPIEFLEFDVVNAEVHHSENNNLYYRLDKPIVTLSVDEETKEILFLNEKH